VRKMVIGTADRRKSVAGEDPASSPGSGLYNSQPGLSSMAWGVPSWLGLGFKARLGPAQGLRPGLGKH
jgi:hypothetical protein